MKSHFCLCFIGCESQSRAAQDVWQAAVKVLSYQKRKGRAQLPKASDEYQSCEWRRKKWIHFLWEERHKISSAAHTTTASNPMFFQTFRFFATYCNRLPRVRSASSMLKGVFTNLSLLKESPTLS